MQPRCVAFHGQRPVHERIKQWKGQGAGIPRGQSEAQVLFTQVELVQQQGQSRCPALLGNAEKGTMGMGHPFSWRETADLQKREKEQNWEYRVSPVS